MKKMFNLIQSMEFNGIKFDCYQNPDNKEDFFGTREQIGRMLEYKDPQNAIDKIHERNQGRLDKFSATVKLSGTDGKRYNTIVYSFKGLLEICRLSNQPRADAVMDFLWEIADEIRKNGGYVIIDHYEDKKIKKIIYNMIENKESVLYIEENGRSTVNVLFWNIIVDEKDKNIITLDEFANIYKYKKDIPIDRIEVLRNINGLETVLRNIDSIPKDVHRIIIYTDSRYIYDIINQGWLEKWKKNNWVPEGNKAISNVDLLDKLYDIVKNFKDKSILLSFSILDERLSDVLFPIDFRFKAVEITN
jgi:ribonuclease HI